MYARASEMLSEVPRPSYETIAKRLEVEYKDEPKGTPTSKTVGEWARHGWIAATDDDAAWTVEVGEPEDVAAVLSVVRWVGFDQWPTQRRARWIARLRRAYPELGEADAYFLSGHAARTYAQVGNPMLPVVNAWLVYRPWRDDGADLRAAVAAGMLPTLAAGSKWPTSPALAVAMWEGAHGGPPPSGQRHDGEMAPVGAEGTMT
jgi:hypothetical protein